MKSKKLKILTYNIHKGMNIGNTKHVLNEIRDQLRRIQADIVFLQEVLGYGLKKNTPDEVENQFEFLADEVWSHYAYGKNAVYAGGHHGNAILSKYPFVLQKNTNISTNRFEQRGLLYSVIEIPEMQKKVNLGCVHLNLLERGRQVQTKTMCQLLGDESPITEALVLAGDFNDWRGKISSELSMHLELKEVFLSQNNEHAKSFPSFSPMVTLDRIYFRNLELVSAKVLTGREWSNLSDHAPLLAEFLIFSE